MIPKETIANHADRTFGSKKNNLCEGFCNKYNYRFDRIIYRFIRGVLKVTNSLWAPFLRQKWQKLSNKTIHIPINSLASVGKIFLHSE